MPLVVFILISMISGSKEAGTLTFSQSSYIALSTVGICCSAFMSIPISIVESRSHGILRRLYCSPCSPARLLACDTIASAIMAVISTLILTFTAVIFFGYRMSGNVINNSCYSMLINKTLQKIVILLAIWICIRKEILIPHRVNCFYFIV